MTINAILWDLDGTIADSTALHFQAWRHTMERLRIPFSYQDFLNSYGRNNTEILGEHLGTTDPGMIEQVAREKEAAYRELLTPGALQPLPGVMEWLACFRTHGLLQVIGSSGPMANIAASVRVMDIGDYFLALVTGTHLPKGKPDPAIFLRCAAVAGVEPSSCLVIEDSIHGIEAAQRAGMHSIAVGAITAGKTLDDILTTPHMPRCVPLASLAAISDPVEMLMHLD